MRRTEHLAARALAAVGLVATCAYLVWRVGFSLHDTDLWLSLPVLAVGFLGAAALTWALWPVPATYRAGNDATGAPALLDAVVLVDQQPDHEVRATLLALRAVEHVAQVVLVDLSARPEMAALANHFHAVYAASDPADRNGVRVMLATVRTPQFVLLEAGDVPTGDIVDRLVAGFDDPQVAVVQGLGVSLAEDSAEHGPNGRHELVFERSSLNPALGRRGHAVWLGSGSLVRTPVGWQWWSTAASMQSRRCLRIVCSERAPLAGWCSGRVGCCALARSRPASVCRCSRGRCGRSRGCAESSS